MDVAVGPSSPSDMPVALQQLSSGWERFDVAGDSTSSFSSDDRFLSYLNQVLMEEGMEDALFMKQVGTDATYQTIMSSFYEIIGEHSPPDLSIHSFSSENIHRKMSYYEYSPDGQHGKGFSWGDDATEEGLIHQSCSGKEEGNDHFKLRTEGDEGDNKEEGNGVRSAEEEGYGKEEGNCSFKLPTEDEGPTLKPTAIEMSFQDLEPESEYASLYVEEPSCVGSSTRASRVSKKSSKKKGTAQVHGLVDLKQVLVSCAQAVEVGDVRKAIGILQELRQVHGASAEASYGLQRAAHYFSEALMARMQGTVAHQLRAMSNNMPSPETFLKVSKLGLEKSPHDKIMYYFANQSILKAAEGASRLHIVDFGSEFGLQWPFLIKALADRKGGPPFLVITNIHVPKPGFDPGEKIEETGQRLATYARAYSVPFQFHTFATSVGEDLDLASLHLHADEILVVNCLKHLRHLADESIDLALTTSPRQKLLTSIHNLNPHLLLFADLSAAYNAPFFVTRFREALNFYCNLIDMMDTLWGEKPERLIVERTCFYTNILNIVACEDTERVERPETYKQWQSRIKQAGFEQLPIPSGVLLRSRCHVKQHYHKDFFVHDDANGWMLLGWKGLIIFAISAWKPSPIR